jgi:hypothetical protein
LYQAFSSEIDFRRDDVLSELKTQSISLNAVFGLGLSEGTGANYYNKYNAKLEQCMSVC